MKTKFKLGPLQNKWLGLLESNLYWQGSGKLCRIVDNDCHFCCLGLLVDQVLKIHGELENYLKRPSRYTYHSLASVLPHEARSRIKMTEKGQSLLIKMNDSERKSFKEIASAIRKRPQSFFYKSA